MRHHLQVFFEYICDICFPPSAEAMLVRDLSEKDIALLSDLSRVERIWSLSHFGNQSIRALIHEAKYHGSTRAYALLATMIERFLRNEPFFVGRLWIPIPLSSVRLKERGYNQVEKVLRAVGKEYRLNVCTDVIKRMRDTRPQTELTRADRHKNVANAFCVMRPDMVTGHDIVLIDDVTTTGATLLSARTALLPYHPSSITLLALSH